MSRLSERIKEVLGDANSTKITVQKKGVAELLELYENEEAIKEITINSEQRNSGVANWSYIVHTVHNLILNEAERHAAKDVGNTIVRERQTLFNLMEKTFSNARNTTGPLLTCTDIMPLIFQILGLKRCRHYHKTYMGILVRSILPFRTYQVNMSFDQWKELLKVCMRLYESAPSCTEKITILDALRMIVEYGCSECDLLPDVKDMLKFLELVYVDVKTNEQILSYSGFKLINIVCQHIASECRVALCQFSETILTDMISMNYSVEKYKLMLLFVQIHHPKGISIVTDGAYAHDWKKWNMLVKSMYLIILQDSKIDVLPISFINLAVEVFKNILETPDFTLDAQPSDLYSYSNPTKRRRVSTKISGLVDIITYNDPNQAWPLIQIITVLLKKYPKCWKSQDLPEFLKILVKLLIKSCKVELITDDIYRLAAVLLKNEKLFSKDDTESSNMHWEKMWDVLLRKLVTLNIRVLEVSNISRSLNMNQNEKSGHALAQLFIINKKVMNPSALLRLYVTNVIKWSTMSLRTLMVFCEHFPLPVDTSILNINMGSPMMNTSSVRLCLLKWLLGVPWNTIKSQIVVNEFCSLLVGIALKSWQWYEEKCQSDEDDMKDTCDCLKKLKISEIMLPEYIEHCHLALAYKTNLIVAKEKKSVTHSMKRNDSTLYMEEVLNSLIHSLGTLTSDFNARNSNDLPTTIMKIAIIAKITAILKQFNMISDNVDESVLTRTMKQYLSSVNNSMEHLDISTSKYNYLVEIMTALNVLYHTQYDKDVAKLIVSTTSRDTIKGIFNVMNVADDETIDYTEANCRSCNFCKKGVIRIQATTALTLFCRMNVGRDKFEIQTKLMMQLLTIDMYDLPHSIHFRMAMIVLESLSEYEKEELSRTYADAPLKFLLELYKQCRKDGTAIRYILDILPCFLMYARDYKHEWKDLMNIISQLHTCLCQKTCGYLVHICYVKCLARVAVIDPSFSSRMLYATPNQSAPVIDYILSSLTNSLFIIRIEAAKCIRKIYSSGNIDFNWKETFFDRIEETLTKLFTVDKIEIENEKPDEYQTMVASTLLTLTAVIAVTGTLQCRALLALIRLNVDKRIKIQTIQNALSTMEKEISVRKLIKDNTSYLLSYWLNSEHLSKPFPWVLLHCESQEEFEKTYVHTLASIQLRNFNVAGTVALCDRVNIPFERVVENVFPQFLSWLLYCNCGEVESNTKKLAIKMFGELLANEKDFVAVKKFSILFNEKFEETLTYLIQRLHDEEYLEHNLGLRTSFPKSDPPHFQKETIDLCIQFVKENLFAQGKSIQYVLAKSRPLELQRILLNLSQNIYNGQFLEYKLKAFHQYFYFCSLIIQEIKQDFFNSVSTYIIKDIGYSLLHLINSSCDTLSELSCKYLYIFLKCVLPRRSEEVKEIFNFAITSLIPIVQAERLPLALEVLKFLIIDQKELMCDVIENLSCFPNTSGFEEIRTVHNSLKYKTENAYSLEREIKHFLNTLRDKHVHCSAEDISHLRLQLSTRKEELRAIFNRLEALRGFAEDCASSVLHQLIYRLVKLTANSNTEVSIQAAMCLGELGPADLTTMILYLGRSHVRETSDFVEILTYKAIMLMTDFLFQNDIELRKASLNTLHIVFSSFWGQKLLDAKYVERLKTLLGEPQDTMGLSFIEPFVGRTNSKMSRVSINSSLVKRILDPSNAIWTIKTNGLYTEWIAETTYEIAKCFPGFYSENFIQVCTFSTDFCELILPRIIYLIIHTDKVLLSAVRSCINKFFDYHFNYNTEMDATVSSARGTTSCDHQIVHCMLNVVNYMRIQMADNVPLNLNYMYIARAAQYCSAFFTAILYAEIACENILSSNDSSVGTSKIDRVCELEPEQGRILQNILRDSHLKIGDPDAIYGCGSSHLKDHTTRINHYMHTRKWDKVMLTQDVELSSGNTSVLREMAIGLHQSGLQSLLGDFISVMSRNGEKINEDVLYENAWRLSNWDLFDPNYMARVQTDRNLKSEITEADYHFYHYQALKCFHESNDMGVQSAIENTRISIIKALRNISLESSKTMYEKLMQLQMIREIEELSSLKQDKYVEFLQKTQQQDITNSNEFQYVEPILTQRTVMYKIKDALNANRNIKNALATTHLEIAKTAANQENVHIAARSLAVLAKHSNLPDKIHDQLLYQESLLAWLSKDLEIGRFLLRNLIHKDSLNPSLRVLALRVYGDWMAETKSENPQAVIKNYYLKSIDTALSIQNQSLDDIKNLHDTRVALAHFADAQFDQISSYIKSPQFESLKECVTYSCKGMNVGPATKDQDLRKAVIINQRQTSNDAAELEHIHKERSNYLVLALRYYLLTLQQSEDYNLLIFRVIALWLDNMHHAEVNELLSTDLDKIPSFKFIPLVPQLAAHMSDVDNEFSGKIYKIMRRCALEHPHHTLPVLLALKNLYGDYEYNQKHKNLREETRVLGARKLLADLAKLDVSLIIREMDKASHALVMLANYEHSSKKSSSVINIPASQEILKIKNFEKVLVPTLTIHVRSSCNYDDVIGIAKYMGTYENVGGVNAPKKVTCVGTDGVCRQQLVKGKDDLRQDAVMQQVFNVMNTLLKACKETKRRKLLIRTYKVVPLTQRSGILEWCDNTIPIVVALMGSNTNPGLHKKYYPKDYTANACKEKMAAVVKASNEIQLKTFMQCCTHMHPALHHFFTEKYPSPETWFERRLAYTRSVATTSIAGYILGLGDRHLSNILIDQKTAEVIHIDFGIAFEQGKVLPIPETVPFRLTRNIEVAMGVCGVEGTMRRCSEKTLSLLRDQRQIIITLLQVLLYDPLFTWAITPAKACNIQSRSSSKSAEINQGSSGTNKTAERALFRIEQKLQGTEEGLPSSVSGQVERLIQQARDPSNLCRLYYGWQPYL